LAKVNFSPSYSPLLIVFGFGTSIANVYRHDDNSVCAKQDEVEDPKSWIQTAVLERLKCQQQMTVDEKPAAIDADVGYLISF
jgi:hypothetical protein